MNMRIGIGYDVHAFAPDRELWLGGIKIPYELGLAGHSDADVALHALCDAMLGALALGDIGQRFPDNDNQYRGIDSKILLQKTGLLVRQEGYRMINADITIVAQEPRLSAHIPLMRETLARVLAIPIQDISIKATTTEHLGFAGRKEGIAAYAVVLLGKQQEGAIPAQGK